MNKTKYIIGGLFSLIGVVAIIVMLSSLKRAGVKPEKSPVGINAQNALELFNHKTSVDNRWFDMTYAMPGSILAISTDRKTLILKTANSTDTICHYNDVAGNKHVKSILPQDEGTFNNFVRESFYAIAQQPGDVKIDSLVNSLNAKSDYSAEVLKANKLSQNDKIFSLIYNKIVGGQKGQVAVTVSAGKLNVLKASDMKCAQIDKAQLAEGMINVYERDSLSAQDKYVIARYQEKFLRKKSAVNGDDKTVLSQKIAAFLGSDSAIAFDKKLPFEFIYLDFRGDKLYVGEKEYKTNDKDIQDIYAALRQNPDRIYYCGPDSQLYYLPNLPKNDSLLWGTVNTNLLSRAQLTNSDIAQNYVLVHNSSKKWIWGAVVLVLSMIGVLWLVLRFFANSTPGEADSSLDDFLKPILSNKNTNAAIEQLIKACDDSSEQKHWPYARLMPTFNEYKQIEKFWVIIDAKKDAIEKILETYDAAFGTSKKSELLSKLDEIKIAIARKITLEILSEISEQKNISQDNIDEIKRGITKKRKFYDDLRQNKDKKEDLIKLLENEFEVKIDSSLREWFDEKQTKSGNDNDLLIEYILSDLKDQLTDIFKDYKKKAREYSKAAALLANNPQGQSFYDYLRERVETIADTSDIETFVDFGCLFKPESNKGIQSKDIILKQYNATRDQIKQFASCCDNNRSMQSVTLKSIALATNAINDLALPLMQIWEIRPDWSQEEFDKSLKTIQFELFHFLITKRLYNTYNNNTDALSDFENEKTSMQQFANAYNEKNIAGTLFIDEKYWKTLIEWSVKIKKSDDCKLFVDNMYQYFISDFVNKAKNINPDSPEDKAWFFEQLFNIAFHSADYVEYVKKEKIPVTQFDNYVLLHNNLDFTKTTHREYQYNHADKSTPFSNAVYEIARELGIKNLRILIDKFQIKL